MKQFFILIMVFTSVFIGGCSIKHPIANDYEQYLNNNKGSSILPTTKTKSTYFIHDETKKHQYQFRAATVGYAHLWIVNFGKILDKTLKSQDVQTAFGALTEKVNKDLKTDNLISFKLENYEFKNHHAYISLHISFETNQNIILNKIYHAEGKSQGGKMFWGGPFAMKNATQQSTKIAVDKILKEFINDLNHIQIDNKNISS